MAPVKIPDCYEADRQADARDLAYTARMMRRPVCPSCGERIMTEECIDLEPFGIAGYGCERCIKRHTVWADDLDIEG